jgi:flagellar motor switch protein FliN/FliY
MSDEPQASGNLSAETPAADAQSPKSTAAATTQAAPSPNENAANIDSLLNQAQEALAGIDEPLPPLPPGVTPFEFKNLAGTSAVNDPAPLDLLRDVQLDLKIELGRTHMHLDEVLRLKHGAVVTLDKLAGDPVDIYANGRLIARGEVLVLNDNFCVRVAELIADDVDPAA